MHNANQQLPNTIKHIQTITQTHANTHVKTYKHKKQLHISKTRKVKNNTLLITSTINNYRQTDKRTHANATLEQLPKSVKRLHTQENKFKTQCDKYQNNYKQTHSKHK